MNKHRSIFIALLVIGALVLPLAVSAQATTSLTEEAINSSFRVTNPARVRVTDVIVDLQPERVSISYAYTRRAPRGSATTTYNVNTIYTPTITDGRLYWTAGSVTVNGHTASDSLVRQINASIESALRNTIRRQLGAGMVTHVVITDTEMTITVG
jgi:hypothetical protein